MGTRSTIPSPEHPSALSNPQSYPQWPLAPHRASVKWLRVQQLRGHCREQNRLSPCSLKRTACWREATFQ